MPRNKRRETLAPEAPKRQKQSGTERIDAKTRCHSALVETLEAAELPATCKSMLVEAIPLTLGVPVKERDKRQVAVAGMIGECLKEMEDKLLQELIDSKMSAKEEVTLLQLEALQAAEHVQGARRRVEEAEEQLALRLSEEDGASGACCALQRRLGALEAQHAARDLQRHAARKERELCEAAFQRLQPDETGGDASSLDPKAVAALCAKLGLEDSLLSTLPLILQKSHASRSYLERAACKLICEALEKHLHQPETTAEPEQLQQGEAEQLESLRREKVEATKLHQEKLQAVQDARKQVEDFQAALTKSQATETLALAKLQDAKHLGRTAELERQLGRLRKGALNAYHALDGPKIHRELEHLEEKLQQLEQQIQQEAARRLAAPAPEPKRRRLRQLEESETLEISVELPPEADLAFAASETRPSGDMEVQKSDPDDEPTLEADDMKSADDPPLPTEAQEVNTKDEAAVAAEETVHESEAHAVEDDAKEEAADAAEEPPEETEAQAAEVDPQDDAADAPEEPVEETEAQEADVDPKDEAADAAEEPVEETEAQEAEDVAEEVVEPTEAQAVDTRDEPPAAEAAVPLEENDEAADAEPMEETQDDLSTCTPSGRSMETQADTATSSTCTPVETAAEEPSAATELDTAPTEPDAEAHPNDSQEWMAVPERPMRDEDGEEASLSPTQRTERSVAELLEVDPEPGDVTVEKDQETCNLPPKDNEPLEEESFPDTLPDSPQREVVQERTSSSPSLFGYATMLLGLGAE